MSFTAITAAIPVLPPTLVQLARRTDHEKPCCENLTAVTPGKAMHAAELRCAHCGPTPRMAAEASGRFPQCDGCAF